MPTGSQTTQVAEATGFLQQMLRIDTTNPPGNELAVARYIEGVLHANDIPCEIVEPVPGRAVLHARLSAGAGSRRAVMVTAHMDVVGVERDRWTVDPFGGEIRDGYIYGRGAIDDKGMLAALLAAFLRVKREVLDAGGKLSRDVIFLATSDEESGGEFGMRWIIENHPRLVDAEFAINEGGRIRVAGGRPLYAAIQTAEKVPTILRMRAHGPPGHAAVPLQGNAIARLARAIVAVAAIDRPIELSATTSEFFSRIATVWPVEGERSAMADIGHRDPDVRARAADTLRQIPKLDALLRDTLTPSVLSAGVRHNVIPAEATATFSLRTLPGHDPLQIVEEMRSAVSDAEVVIEVLSTGVAPPASDYRSAMFAALGDSISELDPSTVVVPYLGAGATESAYLRAHGVQCFGLLPFPLDDNDESRMHGHDERVSVESFAYGCRVMGGALMRMVR